MISAAETATGETPLNSSASVKERVNAGRIQWIGPLLLVPARTVLLIVSQGLVALILFSLHRTSPWRAAGDWWTVYGTLVDIGCLAGLRNFTHREGIRLRDLIGPIRLRWGRDLFLGLGCFAIIFPFFIGGSMAAQWLLFGSQAKTPMAYLVHAHVLPTWALVYSLSLWWMIWSPTEESTYNGYALPRMQALTGRPWRGFLIVGFLWALQHCALPFIPDWRYLAFRFLAFFPGVLVMMLVYLRVKRLGPLIVAHWPMDIVAALMTAVM